MRTFWFFLHVLEPELVVYKCRLWDHRENCNVVGLPSISQGNIYEISDRLRVMIFIV